MAHPINPEMIRRILNYDPKTGIVTWKTPGPARRLGVPLGTKTSKGYLRISIQKKALLLHRAIWVIMTGNQPTNYIDHINGIKTDNRWLNLREASHAENGWNAKLSSRNNTGIKGLCFNKSNGLWRCQIGKTNKHFKDRKLAEDFIREQRAIQHHQFSRT
jgi:hypothetical protein